MVSVAMADGLTSAQLKLRDDVFMFLKEEGYVPEIDSDGDIKFKKEGIVYYVSINEKNETPMYLVLEAVFPYTATNTHAKVVGALEEMNMYKAVKILCFDKSYSCRAEMFLTNAEHFKYTFYKHIDQIMAMKDELDEICAN